MGSRASPAPPSRQPRYACIFQLHKRSCTKGVLRLLATAHLLPMPCNMLAIWLAFLGAVDRWSSIRLGACRAHLSLWLPAGLSSTCAARRIQPSVQQHDCRAVGVLSGASLGAGSCCTLGGLLLLDPCQPASSSPSPRTQRRCSRALQAPMKGRLLDHCASCARHRSFSLQVHEGLQDGRWKQEVQKGRGVHAMQNMGVSCPRF